MLLGAAKYLASTRRFDGIFQPAEEGLGGAFFDIHVSGKGSHGARPESGVDAVLAAAQIAVSLNSIVSRNLQALGAACFTRAMETRLSLG
jgi:hippurate hydrolase